MVPKRDYNFNHQKLHRNPWSEGVFTPAIQILAVQNKITGPKWSKRLRELCDGNCQTEMLKCQHAGVYVVKNYSSTYPPKEAIDWVPYDMNRVVEASLSVPNAKIAL